MKIVVTGLGVLNCIGKNKDDFWKNLCNGESGLATVFPNAIDESNIMKIGGFIHDEDSRLIDPGCNRTTALAMVAFDEAIKDAGIVIDESNKERVGISVGTSIGGYQEVEKYQRSVKNEFEYDTKNSVQIYPAYTAHKIADKYGIEGPLVTNGAACAASSNSFGSALALMKSGECDVIITGGCDPASYMSQYGFFALKALAKELCRPFNKDRKGVLIGEAAAFLVLETYEHAKARNAKIYCEVAGYGCSNDSYHATAPDPKAGGAIRSIERALDYAGIKACDIEYINMHGTGTKLNDVMELLALDMVWGEHAKSVYFSSIKGSVGHTLGCAGALEALASVLSLYNGVIPPTALLEEQIAEGYSVVKDKMIHKKMNFVMSNSFAFGGNSSCVIFKAVKK
ncbi:3-oxoacyl-[acyl-carrier-protein] synthase 2 [Clostridium zeae]|uniref:3-oxoacyl-[acyl-carrier-protein] synthase 2 n=1 Tax=Clostridium zeae TaxID=2759022 RepID=A0ABQ1E7Z7_9CLOT|nr:beta-ketoacyl-[acyl-carrier-protein] synthase family protein [Clostridium zeae]GFZ30879.1 3-oxoacyl-[acyl-carrier-protein] synthase 2 [Clostridium zeae]